MVLGICNGFQILLEAGLLPGAMMRNSGLRYNLPPRVHSRRANRYALHDAAARGQVLRFPSRTTTATTPAMNRRSRNLRESSGRFPIHDSQWQQRCGWQSQRLGEQHRGRLQSRAQRRRSDAASGARSRVRTRFPLNGLVIFQSMAEALVDAS